MYRRETGFTLVELIIVIVVIGILAAIILVAYSGITTKANNTQTVQGVAEYVKGLQMYAARYGHYPIETGYPCLGPHPGTSCGKIGPGGEYCLSSGGTTSQADFDTEMKKVFGGSVPSVSEQEMSCGSLKAHGAYYLKNDSDSGATARIYYFIKGDQPCEGIGGAKSITKLHTDNTTQCRVTLPTV